ncbi:MAG TPA: hypothetical protein HPP94_11925 [Desulfuromonadales bacterium]|nr:hypothetical protein [Desulfuromonadales bacterium]
MFKRAIAILLFSIFVATTAQAADDTNNLRGYGKAVWGMTPNEVIKVEKQRAEKLKQTEKYENLVGIVTIKEIQIGITKFSAIFLFDESGQKLEQVNLNSFENDSSTNAFTFTSVEKLLTEKYGAPTYKKGNASASWKMKHTSINLQLIDLPNANISKVIISYQSSARSKNAVHDL